ncbi:site-2 protease family protein [Halomarina salina]|uniref:Site-2 protease family protein n=1 Tax=Halomarina salina TaxID=1872699 RepID=A0ABD5RPG9_9EURY|nr:site-2 protease family protein [Halomarina salina]
MVDTLWLVLAGIAIYTLLVMAASARGLLPESVRVSGPITTIHTMRGKIFLDKLSRPKRLWRAWGNFGIGLVLVVMFGVFFAVLLSAYTALTNPTPSAVTEPQNVLVIPGVNEFLPLSVAPEIILGLLVGLVVHEGGHGLFCRVGDINISSMGVALLAFIPVGAFVEPDEDDRARADRGDQTRMFAAGVTNNFAVTVVAFALLFGPVIGAIGVAPGAAVGDVVPNSPAANAGIGTGDRIVGVAGQDVSDEGDLQQALSDTPDSAITVTVDNGSGERQVEVQRELILTRTTPSVVGDLNTSGDPPRIQSVDGQSVGSSAQFYDGFRDSPVATVQTDRGSFDVVGGAYIAGLSDDGALATALEDADLPTDATDHSIVLTRFAGERVVTTEEFQRVREDTSPGDTVDVTVYVDGQPHDLRVTLQEDPNSDAGLIGASVPPGTGGIAVDDFGVYPYPAQQYLNILGATGGDLATFFARIGAALFLPLAGAVGQLPYNFAGFVAPYTNFFVVEGPLSALGGGTFLLANVLFWIGWINVNLAFFNCIPAFPLDGGHILRTSTEAVVSRLPVPGGRRLTNTITTAVSVVMLASVVLMVFGPQLLT